MDYYALSKIIEERYQRYIGTTFYFKDPILRASFLEALKNNQITKGPFLEATPAFQRGHKATELFQKITGTVPEPALIQAINGERRLYSHQEEAIQRISAGRNVVIATGTGSGKTEGFLYPILLHLLSESQKGSLTKTQGVRALILYPMNALAYDQRERLGGICKHLEQGKSAFRFTFGQYVGSTPENEKDNWRHAQDAIEHRLPGERITREEMRSTPPHILLTNYSMLEYQLLRPKDSPLFDPPNGQTWRFLVLDEAHQYRGTSGAEMGFLLRRLKQRLRESGQSDKFICIATSASLVGGDQDHAVVARFAETLFGEPFDADDVIVAKPEPLPAPQGTAFPTTLYETLSALLKSGTDQNKFELLPNLIASLRDGINPKIAIGDTLLTDARVADLRQRITGNPQLIETLANDLFQELDSSDRIKTLVQMVNLLTRVEPRNIGGPILSVRYHLLLRALEGAYLRFNPNPQILLTPQGMGKEDVALELALCRECGQHYFVGIERGGKLCEAIRDRSSEQFGTHFFLPLDSEIEENLDDSLTNNIFALCTTCAAIWLMGKTPQCKHDTQIKVIKQPIPNANDAEDKLIRCAACGFSGDDPVREVIHSADGPSAVIATTLFEQLPDENRKVLAFSDGRQDAAYFAWYLGDTERSFRPRAALYRLIAKGDPDGQEGLSLETLARELSRQAVTEGLVAEHADVQTRRSTGWREVYREFLTEQRRISLTGVGLVRWWVSWPSILLPPQVLLSAPWSLNPEQAMSILFLLVDSLRRDGVMDISTTDQITVAWDELERDGKQRQVRLAPPQNDKTIVQWDGPRGWRVQHLTKMLIDSGLPKEEAIKQTIITLRHIWEYLVTASDNQSHDHAFLRRCEDGRRLNPVWWRVSPVTASTPLFKCNICGSLAAIAVKMFCPRGRCPGHLYPVHQEDMQDNHYRLLYQTIGCRPGVLRVEEHTAQISRSIALERQRDFRNGHIGVLSCSTTFELGVDLGDLNTVFLRNVPPEPFNYAQRVGRAGRRAGMPGFAVTFCRRSSHDLYHFAQPQGLLSGKAKPPVTTLNNEKIAQRHLTAITISEFFRANSERFKNVAALIYDWDKPALIIDLMRFFQQKQEIIEQALKSVFDPNLFSSLGVHDGTWIEKIVGENSHLKDVELDVKTDIQRLREIEKLAVEAKKYRKAQWAQRRQQTIEKEDVLSFLSRKVVIPKYGFPVDVVELDTKWSDQQDAESVDLSRNLSIAISEFAPANFVVANKKNWESAGIKIVPERALEVKNYRHCRSHNVLVSWTEGQPESALPCGCPPSNSHGKYVVPIFGFNASQQSPLPIKRKPSRPYTSRPYFLGLDQPTHRNLTIKSGSNRTIITLWPAMPGRMVVLCEGQKGAGFYICKSCGFGKNTLVRQHQTVQGSPCRGTLSRTALAHEFITDIVQIQFHIPIPKHQDDMDEMSLGFGLAQAIVEGFAETIDVPATDLNAIVGGASSGTPPRIVLYDNVPGGAGLVTRMEDINLLLQTLKIAQGRVSGVCGCSEESSCYGCLRSYRNQYIHPSLKRGIVKKYLEEILSKGLVISNQ